MVVYADVIFLINFISAYIMLYILGKAINKVRIRKKDCFLRQFSVRQAQPFIFCVEMPTALSYLMRILAVFLMIFTAFLSKGNSF